MKYIFVPKENYDDGQAELAKYAEGLITLKGTMKVHCFKGIQANQVLVKETSRFCPSCKSKENLSNMCHGWSKHALKKDPLERNQDEGDDNSKRVSTAIVAPTKVAIEEGGFIAAVYRFNETTYIGKIVRFDEDDTFVSFMNGSSRQIETKKEKRHSIGLQTKTNSGYLVKTFCALYHLQRSCPRIQGEAKPNLAWTKIPSSLYRI